VDPTYLPRFARFASSAAFSEPDHTSTLEDHQSYGFRLIDSARVGFPSRLSAGRWNGHDSREAGMVHVADHLSVAALEARYEGCGDVTSSRHFQTIWLLAKGHTVGQVAAMTSFGRRWIEQLLERYNALGPLALGDLRRGNGAAARVLKPELLALLRVRLADPPPDGGVWTSGKVAHWMAGELGLTSLAPQRGWEALRAIDWSIQKPRPRNPKAATPEEQDNFKKKWPTSSSRRRRATPIRRSRRSLPTSTGSA
jgi:transposase